MVCPGSVSASDGIPDVESDFAREGSAAHHLAEQSLILDMDPVNFLGQSIGGIHVDEDMVEAVRVYWNYIQGRKKLPSFRRMIVEERVSLERLDPPRPMFGTCDCILVFKGFVEIVDYKHGIGIYVDVDDNPQAMYYAAGFLLSLPEGTLLPSPVVLTICQPRIPSEKGLVRSKTYDPMVILNWAYTDLLEAARRTLTHKDTFNPGEKQCRFCKASPSCHALRQVAVETAQERFGVVPAPELLSVDEMAQVLDLADTIGVWIKAVETYAHRQATEGRVPPGYKLVPKRANKSWKEGHELKYVLPMANLLGYKTTEVTKLITPAQFIKKTGIDPVDHYEQVSTGTNLVREAEPGVPVNSDAADVFTTKETK
jgi:hypothetical protein